MSETSSNKVVIPEWAFSFQGHRCMCMPLGYRAGGYAMELLGIDREKDYRTFVFSELSSVDSSGCFDDGVQIITGATYGKGLYTRLNYGKLAITVYRPGVGAVRVNVRSDFLESYTGGVGKAFLDLKSQGVNASAMPDEVMSPIIEFISSEPSEAMFAYEVKSDFRYEPGIRPMTRKKCTRCGEYTFEAEGVIVGDEFFCQACHRSIAAPEPA